MLRRFGAKLVLHGADECTQFALGRSDAAGIASGPEKLRGSGILSNLHHIGLSFEPGKALSLSYSVFIFSTKILYE